MSIFSLNNPKRYLAKQFRSKLKSLIYLLDKFDSEEISGVLMNMKKQSESDSQEIFIWEEIKIIADKYVSNKAVFELVNELNKIVNEILA